MTTGRLPLRTRAAVAAGRGAGALSRLLGKGDGSVIGGNLALRLDPGALATLAAGRRIALVSGTNGKTTTTRLLAAALGTAGSVTTNERGANLPTGLVTALAAGDRSAPAVLETDERFLPQVLAATQATVVALLNLTRDQLDRFGEVRSLSAAWRTALSAAPHTAVVANADDPLVVWAAAAAAQVTWVAAGQRWVEDATSCPSCGGHITFEPSGGWACGRCELTRPVVDVWFDDEALHTGLGEHVAFSLGLPGRVNRANAATAATAARHLGVAPADALAAMASTTDVAGRYRTASIGGTSARLLLAKNPAGWMETFDLLRPPPLPVVIGINARDADGRDTSWLYDVPFEQLSGRRVVATGERCHDLSVRLRYAGVVHEVVPDVVAAVSAAGAEADVVCNYTAFQTLNAGIDRG